MACNGRIQPLLETEEVRVDKRRTWLLTGLVFAVCALGLCVVGLSIALASAYAGAAPPERSQGKAVLGLAAAAPPPLWRGYDDLLSNAKYIDLTHDVTVNMPVWEAFGPVSVENAKAASSIKGLVNAGEDFSYAKTGFDVTAYKLSTDQLGTQLDPPAHWNEVGATISDIPPTFAVRPLVVIDLHEKTVAEPSYQATKADCLDWEAKHNTRIPAGSVVFFRSDWSKKWGQANADLPGVAIEALKFLHLERNIMFHGHEALDTDNTPSLQGEAWLMHNNFAQAEGVTNLDQAAEIGCLVNVGFAKLYHGTGGLARYVAICPPEHPFGHTIAELPGAPLMTQSAPLRRDDQGVLQPTPGATPTQYCQEKTSLGCVNGKLVE